MSGQVNDKTVQTYGSESPTEEPVVSDRVCIDREIRARGEDTLDWYQRAERLGRYLVFHVETPVTIGIQGYWGSGKSSFINLVEASLGNPQILEKQKLKAHSLAGLLRFYDCHEGNKNARVYVLRFDSWAFAQTEYTVDELFPVYVAGVIEDYLKIIGKIKDNDRTKSVAQRFGQVIKGGAKITAMTAAGLIPVVGKPAADAAGRVFDEMFAKKPEAVVQDLSSFKLEFQDLVDTLLEPDAGNYSNRLVIVVDDLDRIDPLNAVSITEKLKVFLDVAGVVFVLAADLGIIQDGLERRFGKSVTAADGKNYLDKIVKLQYNVPQLQARDLASLMLGYSVYMEAFGITDANPNDLFEQECFILFQMFTTIAGNVRNSKRVLLNFEFSRYLSGSSENGPSDKDVAYRLLAITLLHQYNHAVAESFYELLANSPQRASERLDNAAIERLVSRTNTNKDSQLLAFLNVLLKRDFTILEWLGSYAAASVGQSETVTEKHEDRGGERELSTK